MYRKIILILLSSVSLSTASFAVDINAMANSIQQKNTPESWVQKGQIPNYDESLLNTPQAFEDAAAAQRMMEIANQTTSSGYSYTCSMIRNVEDKKVFICDADGAMYPSMELCNNACYSKYNCIKESCTQASDVCYYKDPLCPDNSVLNTLTNKCEAMPQTSCINGFTYDFNYDLCIKPVTCSSNGIFNGVTNKCEILVSNTCPSDYQYDASLNGCTKDASCSGNGVYNPSRDVCESASFPSCSSPFVYNATTGKCEAAPVCGGGMTYDPALDKCTMPTTLGCETGYTLNAAVNQCQKSPYCTVGTYSNNYDRCEAAVSISYQCSTSGSSFTDLTTCNTNCTQTALCNSNPTYSCSPTSITWTNNHRVDLSSCSSSSVTFAWYKWVCVGSRTCSWQWKYIGTYTHPLDSVWRDMVSGGDGEDFRWRLSGSTIYWDVYVPGYRTNPPRSWTGSTTLNTNPNYSCPLGSYSCTGNPASCTKPGTCSTIQSCPSSYTLSNGICIANPICSSGGVLNTSVDKCELNPMFVCSAGTYDAALGSCVSNASCSGGVLNTASDVCEAGIINGCEVNYAYNSVTGFCQSNPVCSSGVFDAALDKCKVVASDLCPVGYAVNGDKCVQNPVCDSGSFSPTADACTMTTDHQCSFEFSYSPESRMCEAIPVCNPGSFDPVTDKCVAPCNYYVCPSDNQRYVTMQDCDNACGSFLCERDGNKYSSQYACQSNCKETGTCNER